ncbi:MAG: tetratricopeptide repeat protein [Acidobacteriota bacterium]
MRPATAEACGSSRGRGTLGIVGFLALALGLCSAAYGQGAPEEAAVEPPKDRGGVVRLLERAKEVGSKHPERSLEMAIAALEGARRLGLQDLEAAASNRRGVAHLHLGDYPTAFEHLTESARLARALGDPEAIADAVNNLGILYYFWGTWDRALEHYQEALTLRRASGDREGVAAALNNLGNVSEVAQRWQDALDYYRQSLDLYVELEDVARQASLHNNIGLVHLHREEVDVARGHFESAHRLATEVEDLATLAAAETHFGLVFMTESRFDEAIAAHRRSLGIREGLGDRQGVTISRHNIASAWAYRGETAKAIRELEEALALAEELGIPQLVRDSHGMLSRVREEAGDFEGALANYQAYRDVESRLFNEASQRKLAEVRAELELDKKDRRIEQLELRRDRQRLLRWVLVVVTGLLSAILLLLFGRFRLKERANREIRAKNLALESAQAELERATCAEVAHLSRVASLGELTASVAHELNQPLAAILTNAQVAGTLLEDAELDDPELAGAVQDISLGAQRTWELLRHLRKLARRGEIEPQKLDLRTVIEATVSLLATDARLQGVALELDLPPTPLPAAADPVSLQQVVLNLVQNGIRAAVTGQHGAPEQPPAESETPWVKIVARREGSNISVAVRDSGPEVEGGVLDRMFEPFFTTADDGMGMGLSICQRLVQAHGGEISAHPLPGGGLSVEFRLPADDGAAASADGHPTGPD